MAPSLLITVIQRALNSYLTLDNTAREKLQTLDGKICALELRGLNIKFFLRCKEQNIEVLNDYEGKPDISLSGTPLALLKAGLKGGGSDSFFGDDVEISGDVGVARRLMSILDGIDIDWEEMLSLYTGDFIAHKAGNMVRGLTSWAKDTAPLMGQNIAEYLQQESELLPSPQEVSDFSDEVDVLQDDVARLAQRVAKLAQQLEDRT